MKLIHILVSISCLLCLAYLPIWALLDPYGNAWPKYLVLGVLTGFIVWVLANMIILVWWFLLYLEDHGYLLLTL